MFHHLKIFNIKNQKLQSFLIPTLLLLNILYLFHLLFRKSGQPLCSPNQWRNDMKQKKSTKP